MIKITRDHVIQFLNDEGLFNWKEMPTRGEILINSIFVRDDKKKLGINYKKNGAWNCFKSGISGDWFKFVKEVKRLENDKEAAFYFMRNYMNVQDLMGSFTKEEQEIEEENVFSFPEGTIPFSGQEPYRSYLKSRHFSEEAIGKTNLFVDPTGKRIIFPTYEGGKLSFFAGRSIDPQNPIRWLNKSGGASNPVWNLENVGETIYIFEGIFDAVRVWPNGVAIFGNRLRPGQMEKILARNPWKIIVVMDGDDVGRSAQQRIAKQLSNRHKNIWVHLWEPGPKDFGEMDEIKLNLVKWSAKGLLQHRYNEVSNF